MFIFQHNKMHKHWGISKLFLKRRHYLINSTLLKCHTVVRENNEPNSTSQSMTLIVTIQHNDGLRAVVFFIKGSILPDLLCKICFSGPFLICCEWLMVYKQCLMIHFPCLFFTSLKKNTQALDEYSKWNHGRTCISLFCSRDRVYKVKLCAPYRAPGQVTRAIKCSN